MSRRQRTWLLIDRVFGVVVGVGVGVFVGVFVFGGVVGGGVVGGVVFVGVFVGVCVCVLNLLALAYLSTRGRDHSSRVRRTRSSGLPGGSGWLRVSLGANMRRRLHACTSVDRLVDYLLDRTVDKLPAATRARYAEEWHDYRQHYSGWRLVWWALCVRATAVRTVTALGPARLPRDS